LEEVADNQRADPLGWTGSSLLEKAKHQALRKAFCSLLSSPAVAAQDAALGPWPELATSSRTTRDNFFMRIRATGKRKSRHCLSAGTLPFQTAKNAPLSRNRIERVCPRNGPEQRCAHTLSRGFFFFLCGRIFCGMIRSIN
jgi:hypothetical protein